MQVKKIINTTAAAAASAALGMLVANAAQAANHGKMMKKGMEKCYGVNALKKNDCGIPNVSPCAGTAKMAKDPKAWILVPKGTCKKIAGGSLQAK